MYLARLKGFEPLAHGLEGRCSIRLSYRRKPQDGFHKGFAGAQRKQVPLPLTVTNYTIIPELCQQIFGPMGTVLLGSHGPTGTVLLGSLSWFHFPIALKRGSKRTRPNVHSTGACTPWNHYSLDNSHPKRLPYLPGAR